MRPAILVLAALLLASACVQQPRYQDVPGLQFLVLVTLDGREYLVGRQPEQSGVFYAETRDGKEATRDDFIRAIRMVHRCEHHRVIDISERGSRLDAKAWGCPAR